jgi:hypothetical protein
MITCLKSLLLSAILSFVAYAKVKPSRPVADRIQIFLREEVGDCVRYLQVDFIDRILHHRGLSFVSTRKPDGRKLEEQKL